MISRWECVIGARGERAQSAPRLDVLAFTQCGAFTVHAREERMVIDANRAMFLKAGETYTMENTFGRNAFGFALAFPPDVMNGIAPQLRDPAIRRALPAVVTKEACPRAYLLQHLLFDRLRHGPIENPLEVEESALAIAGHALRPHAIDERAGEKKSARRQTRESVEEAKALLAANFRRTIHLGDVASALDLSPFHLCRLFARHTGLGMHRYLTRLRLRGALEQLTDPGASITDVALEHGFSSHSHFADAFQSEFGMTPKEVRMATRTHLRTLSESLA